MSDALERKLRPIYEALDSYNNKQAVALCTKALKKQGDAIIIKSLKAVALDRLGRDDEALEICEEIRKTNPTDEAVLQYIVMVYKGCKKTKEIIDVYQSAYSQAPRNEELANHWFMALVRVDDRKQMQQAAMKIQKQFKNSRYLFWTIVTIWLQARDNPGGAQTLLTTLTERMLVKAAEEGHIKDYEALQLYIEVLETQGKLGEALAVVNGELGNLCKVSADRKRIVARLAKASKNWKLLLTVSKELLLTSPDDWMSYCNYIEALKRLLLDTEDPSTKENLIEQARSLFSVLESKASNGKRLKRGPLLAGLELEKMLICSGQAVDDTSKMSGLITAYLAQFGSTLSCFDDLRPYLQFTSASYVQSLFEGASRAAEEDLSTSSVRNLVNVEKIRRWSEKKLSSNQAKARSEYYMTTYQRTMPLGEKFDERELQPGDDYILLGAHSLLDLYGEDRGQRQLLGDAALILEYGSARSKFNYQIKLLLIRVYFELGAHKRLLEVATTMDIKQIQHDTLSYLFTDDLEYLGCPESAMRAVVKSLTIYGSNGRETPEMIVQAFKYGTYSKIPEFIRFRDRLKKSLQYAVSQRQLYRVEILRRFPALDNLGYYLEILDDDFLKYTDDHINSLSDNRDVTLLANWSAIERPIASVVSGTQFPRKRELWLKLHSLIPLILRGICNAETAEWFGHHQELKKVIDIGKDGNEELDEIAAADALYNVSAVLLTIRDVPPSAPLDLSDFQNILDRLKATVPSHFVEQALSYDHLRCLTLFLESCNYACIGLAAITALIQGPQKARGKAVCTPTVESLTSAIRAILVTFRDELSALKKITTNPDVVPLTKEHPSWMNAQAQKIRQDVETELVASWTSSLDALIASVSVRIDRKA
ncbi:N-acetyltransferase B complex non catalytic subunit-domain-containing protein [Powellomyces hirtus]|nr:N-acetyltransferase B complex non catalytic subunit-domain-containing protein [Powellomyces hirtus]